MRLFLLIISIAVLSGCGGINAIKKTTYLEPGMKVSEVRNIMGDPISSEFSNGFMVWKYSLHQPWVGWVPHYLAFDKHRLLVSWKANMGEYFATQELWLQSLPKTHNVNVNANHTIND